MRKFFEGCRDGTLLAVCAVVIACIGYSAGYQDGRLRYKTESRQQTNRHWLMDTNIASPSKKLTIIKGDLRIMGNIILEGCIRMPPNSEMIYSDTITRHGDAATENAYGR